LLVLVLAILFLGFDLHRRDEASRAHRLRVLYAMGVGSFFFCVSFQIARAGEYLIPACGLILVLLLERWRDYWRPLTAGLFALVAAQGLYVAHVYRDELPKNGGDRVRETFKAIAAIPAEPRGAKVFNCEW